MCMKEENDNEQTEEIIHLMKLYKNLSLCTFVFIRLWKSQLIF